MGEEKKLSKRQALRAKRRRDEMVRRTSVIGVIIVGALLVAFALIYPTLKPVGAIAPANSRSRTMVNDNAMGDPTAPIKIEEFSDYQCPYCGRFVTETEAQIEDAYVATGKVYFVYRSMGDFIGQESQAAAEAAYCAGEQNKYWEYHDILFANQTGENVGAFTDRRLQAFAQELALDMSAFNTCYNSNQFAGRVQQDFVDGQAAGVTGTPAFVITYEVNGEPQQRFIAGAYPFSEFQTQIEAALAEMGLQ
jgi:protein-disulfide isomerase